MALRLHNALTGRLEDFSPASPPVISFLWKKAPGEDLRCGAFVATLMDSLVYLGYGIDQAAADAGGVVELYCGWSRPPAGAKLWLKPALCRAPRELSLSDAQWRYLLLKTHYRKTPDFSARAVSEVLGEFAFLRDSVRRLEAEHGGSAVNATGLAGYKKRLRDAVAQDLDFPAALNALLDALRPGALSPGSRLGAWREAQSAMSLLTSDLSGA